MEEQIHQTCASKVNEVCCWTIHFHVVKSTTVRSWIDYKYRGLLLLFINGAGLCVHANFGLL